MATLLHFDEAKATQAAGFFLALRGGRMHYLKLIKLLYIADRQALQSRGIPITTDQYVSMDHGPVVSNIHNLIVEEHPGSQWARYISPPLGDYEIELLSPSPTGLLSPAEENLMRAVFAQFGQWNRWDIVRHVHGFAEWRSPHGRALPIEVRSILAAGGDQEPEINAILLELQSITAASR